MSFAGTGEGAARLRRALRGQRRIREGAEEAANAALSGTATTSDPYYTDPLTGVRYRRGVLGVHRLDQTDPVVWWG